MLPEFKKRIDTLRDILVGAVPSPAGQIEQITYALIYKFMSDIDDRAASLPGGKRTYFTGEYEKYGWHELMTSTLGAHDRLTLYREALGSLAKNPGLPTLFQEIYQNAYLTFNDPRVLTLFLKEIDNFKHSNSDDIGDAYEYLLQITGAQGDVGQFRTPRHIIKFIVEAVNPTKNDSVLDPAVGTAGFLIAAYNHVKGHHDGVDDITGLPNKHEQDLSSDERAKMYKNYHGFDIDPTMVRTAKVNMYLHGFKTPDIKNHDSLSSEDWWNERYDVILANPPFMSPKGGIKPHDKFGIVANRAEVLFVDYIASHLKPTGRAGIVVPEGIIFQSGKAYKELRKNLVDNYLYAVVSLPAGVFQPYSGVKTSVLLLDKELAKQHDDILFVKIENDGFSLGTQRREKSGSQFSEALELIEKFRVGQEVTSEWAHAIPREVIGESDDYNLSGDKYNLIEQLEHKDYPMVELGDVLDVFSGFAFKSSKFNEARVGLPVIRIRDVKPAKTKTFYSGEFDEKYLVNNDDILIGMDGEFNTNIWHGGKALLNQRVARLQNFRNVEKNYVYYLIKQKLKDIEAKTFAVTVKHISAKQIKEIKIPLPPIGIQREIVAELDDYHKIIDAAQTIVKTYKPTVKINPEWKSTKLGKIVNLTGGGTPSRNEKSYWGNGIEGIKWITSKYITNHHTVKAFETITDKGLKGSSTNIAPAGSTVLITRVSVGKFAYLEHDYAINQDLTAMVVKDEAVLDEKFLFYTAEKLAEQVKASAVGIGVVGVTRQFVSGLDVMLPTLDEQKRIVAELESEQRLIDANKKLIEIFRQKIKSKIAEVWGE